MTCGIKSTRRKERGRGIASGRACASSRTCVALCAARATSRRVSVPLATALASAHSTQHVIATRRASSRCVPQLYCRLRSLSTIQVLLPAPPEARPVSLTLPARKGGGAADAYSCAAATPAGAGSGAQAPPAAVAGVLVLVLVLVRLRLRTRVGHAAQRPGHRQWQRQYVIGKGAQRSWYRPQGRRVGPNTMS